MMGSVDDGTLDYDNNNDSNENDTHAYDDDTANEIN